MTKKEAIELEQFCEELLTEAAKISYFQPKCYVSLSLNDRLKIAFDNNCIVFKVSEDCRQIDIKYIVYNGEYDDFIYLADALTKCIFTNNETFAKLVWSYNHMLELKESRIYRGFTYE